MDSYRIGEMVINVGVRSIPKALIAESASATGFHARMVCSSESLPKGEAQLIESGSKQISAMMKDAESG